MIYNLQQGDAGYQDAVECANAVATVIHIKAGIIVVVYILFKKKKDCRGIVTKFLLLSFQSNYQLLEFFSYKQLN